jgi:hypothetical protein
MMDMSHVHGLEQFFVLGLIAQGKVKAGVGEGHTRAAHDARLVILIVIVAKCEYPDLVPGAFEDALV